MSWKRKWLLSWTIITSVSLGCVHTEGGVSQQNPSSPRTPQLESDPRGAVLAGYQEYFQQPSQPELQLGNPQTLSGMPVQSSNIPDLTSPAFNAPGIPVIPGHIENGGFDHLPFCHPCPQIPNCENLCERDKAVLFTMLERARVDLKKLNVEKSSLVSEKSLLEKQIGELSARLCSAGTENIVKSHEIARLSNELTALHYRYETVTHALNSLQEKLIQKECQLACCNDQVRWLQQQNAHLHEMNMTQMLLNEKDLKLKEVQIEGARQQALAAYQMMAMKCCSPPCGPCPPYGPIITDLSKTLVPSGPMAPQQATPFGPTPSQGGVSPGGVSPGGVSPGGVAPGGVSPGGVAPGGVAPGGVAPGGVSTGGVSTGGAAPGVAPGGVAPGGVAPGGVSPGGVSPGGVSPGGVSPGGVAPGGVAPGGVSTGGVSTGGVSTGGSAAASSSPGSGSGGGGGLGGLLGGILSIFGG